MMDLVREWQRTEGGRSKFCRIEAALAKQLPVVRRMRGSVAHDVFQTRALHLQKLIQRQPLRALQCTQDAQALAAVLEIPQRMKYVA